MFDFEKLDVYQLTKDQNVKVLSFLKKIKDADPYILDQWKRASVSSLLNLAEGTGRMVDADKRHFLTISRGAIFESVAILDLLNSQNLIPENVYQELYTNYEQISKMLLGMYRSYAK
ncbi:MAG TPA: four helix bundle protein [Bacteroidales bacterium]|mgnify:FL=1|nr:four helix bundle protein [Bacteroidales bacterium]HPS74694.1 four helix bundle protein [Bacteroidales bacterium]